MVEKIIFFIITVGILGVLLWMTYKKEKILFGTLFVCSLAILTAFYLFQYAAALYFRCYEYLLVDNHYFHRKHQNDH